MKKLFFELAPDRPREHFQARADYEHSAAALEEDGENELAFEERVRVEDLLIQRLGRDEDAVLTEGLQRKRRLKGNHIFRNILLHPYV